MFPSRISGAALPRLDVRLHLAALWTATMFIFAYVDLFSLYRPDVRENLDRGKVFVFEVSQPVLFGMTAYVIIPSLMIYLSLSLPYRANRIANLAAAIFYLVTLLAGAIGEWNYYILGSAIETILLALVVHHAWTWRVGADPARIR